MSAWFEPLPGDQPNETSRPIWDEEDEEGGIMESVSDYRGQHQPSSDGVTLDRALEAFPSIDTMPDIYSFGPAYGVSITAILTHRGRPDAWVRVYRAAPAPVEAINPGDWVSTSRAYAEQHAIQDDDEANDWPILERLVRARELRTDGDDVNEWGWFPNA